MEKDRRILVLYTDAICNLNCRYCFIDKNPALLKIDNELDKSFKGDYYFEFAKKVFPDPNQLQEVQIWGGEPTLHLDRTHHTITKLLNYYPNLHDFMFSTNVTPDNWIETITNFIEVICQDKNRTIQLEIQLSIDGPTAINDVNRGIGVTEKFTKNFSALISIVDNILDKYPNLSLVTHFKPTLDGDSIRKLQDESTVIDYYKFLEQYKLISNYVTNSRFSFHPAIPNTACPSPHTKEEGILFANLCKLTRAIEERNKTEHIFDYYDIITPFASNRPYDKKNNCNYGNCGTGRSVVGLLPNNMISCCHNGFTELLSDYKHYCIENLNNPNRTIDFNLFDSNTIENSMVFPYDYLSMYEKQVELYFVKEEHFQMLNIISEIQLLARNNQIDNKYNNIDFATEAANFLLSHTSYCIRDNIGTSGSKTIVPLGLLKLLLNGAKEYIEEN